MVCRSRERGERAVEEVRHKTGNNNVLLKASGILLRDPLLINPRLVPLEGGVQRFTE